MPSHDLDKVYQLFQDIGICRNFLGEKNDNAFKKKVFENFSKVESQEIWDAGMLVNTTSYIVKSLGTVAGYL